MNPNSKSLPSTLARAFLLVVTQYLTLTFTIHFGESTREFPPTLPFLKKKVSFTFLILTFLIEKVLPLLHLPSSGRVSLPPPQPCPKLLPKVVLSLGLYLSTMETPNVSNVDMVSYVVAHVSPNVQ
jgi:hypothetical protein